MPGEVLGQALPLLGQGIGYDATCLHPAPEGVCIEHPRELFCVRLAPSQALCLLIVKAAILRQAPSALRNKNAEVLCNDVPRQAVFGQRLQRHIFPRRCCCCQLWIGLRPHLLQVLQEPARAAFQTRISRAIEGLLEEPESAPPSRLQLRKLKTIHQAGWSCPEDIVGPISIGMHCQARDAFQQLHPRIPGEDFAVVFQNNFRGMYMEMS
mmetsp:Transcript_30007/g.53681  ORF Transcript_30007/g.53681 Transcript_30007/m.53681 type:complete len:210 (+) Transcript_30007:570-1199(+)